MINFTSEIFFLILLSFFIVYLTFSFNRAILYDDPLIFQLKYDLMKIDPRVKDIHFYASNKSFTEDKRRIYLCLKDREENYYPYNMLIYVSCHELAHAFSSTIDTDHTSEEFRTNYYNLLVKARDLGLYDPDEPVVENYCSYE